MLGVVGVNSWVRTVDYILIFGVKAILQEKGSGVFIPTNYVSAPPPSFVLVVVNDQEPRQRIKIAWRLIIGN